MIRDQYTNYALIEKAIVYVNDHIKEQPSLNQIAAAVNFSPFHFQRIFTKWAGVSPKKFIEYISLDYTKELLKNRMTLLDVTHNNGLSGSSRLHDLFVSIDRMTPGELKSGSDRLAINYCFADSPFGKIIIASTHRGICHIHFEKDEAKALNGLKSHFPNASYDQVKDKFQREVLLFFRGDLSQPDQIKLHLAATEFQIKVWKSLLKIPMGMLSSYGDIAHHIGKPMAFRAVGTAIGNNPIAFIIPCHRVIQNNGKIGQYMWGSEKKAAIIGWEISKSGNKMRNI